MCVFFQNLIISQAIRGLGFSVATVSMTTLSLQLGCQLRRGLTTLALTMAV